MATRGARLMFFLSLLSCVLVKVQSRLGGFQENAEHDVQHANMTGVVSIGNQSNQSVDGPPPITACTHRVYSWTGAKCGGGDTVATCCTIGIDNGFSCATSEGCYEGAPCYADGKYHVWPLGGKEHGCRRRSILPPVPPPVPPRPTPTPAPTLATTTTTTIMTTTTTTTTCVCCIDETDYEKSEDTVFGRKLIVNGEDLVATGQWRSEFDWVVRIQWVMGDEQLPTCGGTLWNNYVLTAAHCVPNYKFTTDGTPMTGCVSRGPGHYEEGSPPRFENIAKIIRVVRNFWGGNTDSPEHDIAILQLDRAPETGGLPIRFARTMPPTGTDVFLVSYGPNQVSGSRTYELERASYNLISQHYYFLDQDLLNKELRTWKGGAWTRSNGNARVIGGDSGSPWLVVRETAIGRTAVILGVTHGSVYPVSFPQNVIDEPPYFQGYPTEEIVAPFAYKHPEDPGGENPPFPYPQDPTDSEDVVAAMRDLNFPFYDGDTDESSQYQLYTKLRSTSSISVPTNVSSATGNAKDSAMISGCYGKSAISWNLAVISFLMYF